MNIKLTFNILGSKCSTPVQMKAQWHRRIASVWKPPWRVPDTAARSEGRGGCSCRWPTEPRRMEITASWPTDRNTWGKCHIWGVRNPLQNCVHSACALANEPSLVWCALLISEPPVDEQCRVWSTCGRVSLGTSELQRAKVQTYLTSGGESAGLQCRAALVESVNRHEYSR